MSLLNDLLTRKEKAETISNDVFQHNMTAVDNYLEINRQIYILSMLKFLSDTAPKSMNPQKIKAHMERVEKVLINCCNNKDELHTEVESFLNGLKIDNINSYANALRVFIFQNTKLPKV